MRIILFDDSSIRSSLLPFTFTRPVAGIRLGILTLAEKWQLRTQMEVSHLTQAYLQPKFGPALAEGPALFVNGAICPQAELAATIQSLSLGEKLQQDGLLVAFHGTYHPGMTLATLAREMAQAQGHREPADQVRIVRHLWDIFRLTGDEIRADFELLTQGRQSQPLTDPHTRVYNPELIFIEEGVKIRAAILNAENGPIYLGRNADVQEGAIIRGPFALGEASQVSAGARMRGDISIGPFCKVGGEVSNSVLFAHANKSHDGYLGNSVIGEWCNLGADTNNSNLKNNYANVKLWSHAENRYEDSGLMFCGLMMGDHSKCGINTMFNTGTVVGVSANIYGAGLPPTFVPSFSWSSPGGTETYRLPKALEVASRTLARRELPLGPLDQAILTHVFETTQKDRESF